MSLENRKALFSMAYANAVAAGAGVEMQPCGRQADADGVDVQFMASGRYGDFQSPRLDAQIKATARPVYDGDFLKYDLPAKNHNDLICAERVLPMILVVVVLPGDDPDQWLEHTPEALLMRKCGYALSIAGHEPSANRQSVRVSIPLSARFTPEALVGFLAQAKPGGAP